MYKLIPLNMIIIIYFDIFLYPLLYFKIFIYKILFIKKLILINFELEFAIKFI